MFGRKQLMAQVISAQEALQSRLVELHGLLQGGTLSEVERLEIERAIGEVRVKLAHDTSCVRKNGHEKEKTP